MWLLFIILIVAIPFYLLFTSSTKFTAFKSRQLNRQRNWRFVP